MIIKIIFHPNLPELIFNAVIIIIIIIIIIKTKYQSRFTLKK